MAHELLRRAVDAAIPGFARASAHDIEAAAKKAADVVRTLRSGGRQRTSCKDVTFAWYDNPKAANPSQVGKFALGVSA
jgi:hypothetical protein